MTEGYHPRYGEKVHAPLPAIIDRLLSNVAKPKLERPQRVRAIIFDPSGTSILLILRVRAGVDPYSVFPGGGMEEHESSPLVTRDRELREELSIDPAAVEFAPTFIEFDNQWMYVGATSNTSQELRFAGPEMNGPVSKGTFSPAWVELKMLEQVNLVPYELRELILGNASN